MATSWRIASDDLQMLRHRNGTRQSLLSKLGSGYSQFTPIDDEFSIIETRYATKRDFSIFNRIDSGKQRLVLTLCLKGNSRYIGDDGNAIDFEQGFTTLTSFNVANGERQYQSNRDIHQLRFSIGANWLNRHYSQEQTAKLFSDGSMRKISFRPITQQGELLCRQFNTCKSTASADKLYLQGLAMMLIACELAPVFSDDSKTPAKLTARDRQIAVAARDILRREYRNPPTVEQLAGSVGTNSFKLKTLFHQCFNNTPYGILTEIRMNEAYRILSTSRCHVNTAAYAVGYQHASNFSSAFKKFFGVSPKAISKQ